MVCSGDCLLLSNPDTIAIFNHGVGPQYCETRTVVLYGPMHDVIEVMMESVARGACGKCMMICCVLIGCTRSDSTHAWDLLVRGLPDHLATVAFQ